MKCPVKQFPSVNDIRFKEYPHKLLSVILHNYKTIICHLCAVNTSMGSGGEGKEERGRQGEVS